jgi:hypothetical protein
MHSGDVPRLAQRAAGRDYGVADQVGAEAELDEPEVAAPPPSDTSTPDIASAASAPIAPAR